MKTTSCICIVMVTVCACANQMTSNEYESLELRPARTYKGLTLIPVYANDNFVKNRNHVGSYLTLKNAVDQKKLVVTEHITAESAEHRSVNTLFIENVSSDTVFILNGETVIGGHQDRMIKTDVVIAPHSGKIDLSVYCIEAHRWDGPDELFSVPEMSLPPGDIRDAGVANEPQDQVWAKVDEVLLERKISSETARLLDVQLDTKLKKEIYTYFDSLSIDFNADVHIVGVVALSGKAIIGCDLFVTHDLLKKHLPNLVQSYASQVTDISIPSCDPEIAESYWQRVMVTIKKPEGFLRTTSAPRKGKDPVHFSMTL
jgi:hypothetical protein